MQTTHPKSVKRAHVAIYILIATVLVYSLLGIWLLPPRYPKYEALINAIVLRDLNGMERCLRSGTNPNEFPVDERSLAYENDVSPLDAAIQTRDTQIVGLLLKYHADPNLGDGWMYNPLAGAVSNDDVNMMKFLVRNGAKVNDDATGSWALYRAAMDGKIKSVEYLLLVGADPNTILSGQDSLVHALHIVNGSPQIIIMLQAHGGKDFMKGDAQLKITPPQ